MYAADPEVAVYGVSVVYTVAFGPLYTVPEDPVVAVYVFVLLLYISELLLTVGPDAVYNTTCPSGYVTLAAYDPSLLVYTTADPPFVPVNVYLVNDAWSVAAVEV